MVIIVDFFASHESSIQERKTVFRGIDRFLCKVGEIFAEVCHAFCVHGSSPASTGARKGAICCEDPSARCLGPEKICHLGDCSIADFVGSIDDELSCYVVVFDPSEDECVIVFNVITVKVPVVKIV